MKRSILVCLLSVALATGVLSAGVAAPLAELRGPDDWKARKFEDD